MHIDKIILIIASNIYLNNCGSQMIPCTKSEFICSRYLSFEPLKNDFFGLDLNTHSIFCFQDH